MTDKTSWQPVGSWYDASLGNEGDYTHSQIVVPGVLRLLGLSPASRLLDLGCGQGILARNLPRSVSYTGIDIAPSLITAAKKRDTNPTHRYFVGDITDRLPIQENATHAAIILALDNLEHPERAIKNAANHLIPGGVIVFVINHPCFRIPRQSGWGIDETNKIQYRRINRYLSPISIPITMHPGKGYSSPVTWTYHFPISSYVKWIADVHCTTISMEEWTSGKKSVGKAASMENRARDEFPLFLAVKAQKSTN